MVASALVGALLAGSVVGASAASAAPPTPDSGSGAGGTTVTVEAPVAPVDVTFTQIAASSNHTVALGSDGHAYAWGHNQWGQLGIGTSGANTGKQHPTLVNDPAGVPADFTFTQVAAAGLHTFALGSDGNAYAWGSNDQGVLGDGTSLERNVPTLVSKPAGVPAGFTFTQISAGYYHTAAMGSDGNAYIWGSNQYGQLGNGHSNNEFPEFPAWIVPTLLSTPAGVTFTQISAGTWHTAALGSDGSIYSWGNNFAGERGDTQEWWRNKSPQKIASSPAGVTFTQITARFSWTLAVASDGQAYAWGSNVFGELGNGTIGPSSNPLPAEVQNPAGVAADFAFTKIVPGGSHAVALGNDGNIYAWGQNSGGQLGNTTFVGSNGLPTIVSHPAGVPAGFTFTQIWAGGAQTYALGNDGNAYAWGENNSGQLGDGTETDKNTPTLVTWPPGVVTGVLFDGKPGTGLAVNPDGTYQVKTPANTKCGVDVTVQWTLDGEPQPDIVHPSGFTYLQAPTITDPAGATAPVNGSASFTTTPSGCTVPVSSAWEYSSNNGETWSSALALAGVTVDAAGTTLTVASIPATYHGYQFRAVATNTGGTVTSAAATLSVEASAQAKVTYDANGGTGTMADTTGVTGEQVTLAANKFTRAGYTFASWNTKADGSGTGYAARASYPSLPVGGVTLYAQWKQVSPQLPCSEPRKIPVFEDVALSQHFYKEIDWMHCMKYSTGWRQPPRKPVYKPTDNLSREAMAAFIYRMEAPKNYQAPKVSPFADMKAGDPFYKEISWMHESKLSTGWRESSGKPTFRPKDKLSREAMAAFIYRMEAPKSYKAPAKSPMADMKPGMSFYKEISWMYDEDLSTGNRVGNTKEYWPKDKLSRQAMAAFIHRLVTDYRVNN